MAWLIFTAVSFGTFGMLMGWMLGYQAGFATAAARAKQPDGEN